MKKTLIQVTLLLAGFGAAVAEDIKTPETMQAYAAGYKAAFTCSALFNAGKSVDSLTEHEFYGIYPALRPYFDKLPAADVDMEKKRVSVWYNDSMPPRISQWRPHLGCAQLPTGAEAGDAQYLPAIDIDRPNTSDTQPWKQVNNGSAVLKSLLKDIMVNPQYGKDARTSAVLVANPDALLSEVYIEGYGPHTSQRTWSVAKSIAATIIGAAVHDGFLDVKKPAMIDEWQSPIDPRKRITLENLLQMASGLDSNKAGNRTDRLYAGGGRVSDSATENALETAPGTRWKYANNDTLLAVRALKNAFPNTSTYNKYPFMALLNKLGMNDTFLETDWEGNFILSSQVWTTSRDLARLGVLYLQDGIWNGERLLPEGWGGYVSAATGPQPPKGYPGYGAQFWLYNERFPDIPNDTYAARGNRGQFLVIVPSRNVVMVRRGYDPAGGDGFKLNRFIKDVLAVLE